jgi:hypothetical protein
MAEAYSLPGIVALSSRLSDLDLQGVFVFVFELIVGTLSCYRDIVAEFVGGT